MIKSRLIEILRTCSKKELKTLNKWLRSPAHNQREDVVLLYEYLLKDDHLRKDAYLGKTVAFPHVYPNEDYDDAKFRQTIFFFMKALEDFLIYQEIRESDVQSKMTLSRVYRKRRLNRHFEKNMKQIESLQQKQVYRNRDYHRNEFYRLQEEYDFVVSQEKRTIDMNLQEVSDTLDISYLADKLRHSCHMLAHQTVYKVDYNLSLMTELFNHIESNPKILEIPAIAIYYYSYMTVTDKANESHFHNLKSQIFENGHLFPQRELMALYIIALNYCIGQKNMGVLHFIRESFELYQQGIETGILIQRGQISRFTFINAVINGTFVKEFTWVEDFIHNYKGYLDDKSREDVVQFSLSKLYYEKSDYDKALRICSQMDYKDILMSLVSKTMVLKIYYEQRELDVLESYLESFRSYLSRKKATAYHKSNFKNIIRLTKKLVRINPYDPKGKSKIIKEIETTNPLTERAWLMEQAERL